jgi:type III pantothenate kinase
MLLVIDIGNTNVVWGVYDGTALMAHWRVATDSKTTPDEYGILFTNLLASAGILPRQVTGAIVSCVVPGLTDTFETLVEQYFHQRPLFVTSETDTGLTLRYLNPGEIGSDRLVNAAAAYHKYRRDLIIVDFGTATTFCVVTKDAEYLGGVIAPGLGISAEALFSRAAKLSKVELTRPKTVIGANTSESIQSGLIFGYSGLVDALVRRIEQELGRAVYVVGTGGLCSTIVPETSSIHTVEPLLTLEGLSLLYRRAKGDHLSTVWP